MSILSVIFRSLKEMLWPSRFLPFFLLYFSLAVAAYLLFLPLVGAVFQTQLLEQAPVLLFDIALLFFIFVLGLLVNLWFTAALVENVKSKKSFERSLTAVKKSYLQLVALGAAVVLLYLASAVFGYYQSLVSMVLDWVLLFAMPAVVLHTVSFEKGIKESFQIFKAKALETIAFWLANRFVLFVMFLVSIFFLSFATAPLLVASMSAEELQSFATSSGTRMQVLGLLLADKLFMIVVIAVATFFLSIANVFNYVSKTYYFLELSKRTQKATTREKRKR